MSEVVYTSEVTIERDEGPLRRAFLPAGDEPVAFGVHGGIAEAYGISAEDSPRPTARWTTSSLPRVGD